jgi:flagellar hook-basal body complex protein FliE
LAVQSGWLGGDQARLLAPAHAGENKSKAQTGSNERLRELLEERYEILKTLVESEKHLVKIGQGSSRRIVEATAAMLRAEADLCETDSARIEIHEKIVAALRECEALIDREAKAGMAGQNDVMRTKLPRLEAQIELEKLKLAQQASQ